MLMCFSCWYYHPPVVQPIIGQLQGHLHKGVWVELEAADVILAITLKVVGVDF